MREHRRMRDHGEPVDGTPIHVSREPLADKHVFAQRHGTRGGAGEDRAVLPRRDDRVANRTATQH